jgi:hypothetical protein
MKIIKVTLSCIAVLLLGACASNKKLSESYDRGYEAGAGDEMRKLYWTKAQMEKNRNETDLSGNKIRYVEIQTPTVTADGRVLEDNPVYLPVYE